MREPRDSKNKSRDYSLSHLKQWIILAVVILFLPLLLGLALIYGLAWFIQGAWLGLRVRLQWYPQGKRMLFVYSNSPNWKDYVEANLLPKIQPQAVILNWSDRSQWKWKRKPLEVQVFQHWSGIYGFYILKNKMRWDGHDFNPIAITFIPWWRRRVFRFWQPFKDFKHGKDRPLREIETQLFEVLKARAMRSVNFCESGGGNKNQLQ